jgi:phosphoglycolate phosphatase
MIKDILFDLDGTLIDSAPSILASYAAVLSAAGLAPRVRLEPGIVGPALRPTLTLLTGIEAGSRLDELADAFRRHYDSECIHSTAVYEGVTDTLRTLAQRARLYIVTNKRIAPTRAIVEAFGWQPLLAGVYAMDAFEPALGSKAEVLGEVMRRHGVDRATAAYVGDRPEDGAAASENHLKFFWAAWGYGNFGDIGVACHRLDTPFQLQDLDAIAQAAQGGNLRRL